MQDDHINHHRRHYRPHIIRGRAGRGGSVRGWDVRKHTPEPWRVGRPGTVVSDTPVPEIGGSDAIEYYGGHLIGESIIEANARRIVACVNACAGMRNDELEGGLLIGVMQSKIDRLECQRDKLLDAMRQTLAMLRVTSHGPSAANKAEDMLHAAICSIGSGHSPDAAPKLGGE